MSDPTVLDVISAAIDVAGEADTAPETPDTLPETLETSPEVPESTPAAEAAPEGDAAAPKGDEPEVGDPGEVAADGRVRDAQGRFAAKKPDGEVAEKPAIEPAKPAAPAAAAKPKDHVNDPIPPQLKAETRERMQHLVEIAKEKTTQIEQVNGDLQAIMAPIQAAGVTAEQFQETVQLLGLINKGDIPSLTEAHKRFQETADELARAIGAVPVGVDPLEGNPDLIQRVQNNAMTRKDAEDVAAARRLQAVQQQTQQRTQQQTAQSQQMQQARQQGGQAVKTVEGSYRAIDPMFAAKDAIIKADASFVQSVRGAHPSQWAQMYADKYASIKLPPVAPAPQTNGASRPNGSNQPLRGKSPAGGTVTTPGSALEAMNAALVN